jgi:hypothetical protein
MKAIFELLRELFGSKAAPVAPTVLAVATDVPGDAVTVREIDDPAVAADLFRRKFGQEIPNFPKHFVAMIGEQCAGYVHYSAWQGDYLCGGLCIDERAYRALNVEQRAWIRERGGIAEIMMRGAHPSLEDGAVIWAYMGNKQAQSVAFRIGYVATTSPCLFVRWQHSLSDIDKQKKMDMAMKLEPF